MALSREDSERLARCERMLEQLLALMPGKPREGFVNESEYKRALLELRRGNAEPLAAYKRKGGIIPKLAVQK